MTLYSTFGKCQVRRLKVKTFFENSTLFAKKKKQKKLDFRHTLKQNDYYNSSRENWKAATAKSPAYPISGMTTL